MVIPRSFVSHLLHSFSSLSLSVPGGHFFVSCQVVLNISRDGKRASAFNAFLPFFFPLLFLPFLNEERWKSNFLSRHERDFTLTHSEEHSRIFVPFHLFTIHTAHPEIPLFLPSYSGNTACKFFTPFIHRRYNLASATNPNISRPEIAVHSPSFSAYYITPWILSVIFSISKRKYRARRTIDLETKQLVRLFDALSISRVIAD